ncbi:carbon-phosphorus lyase complex subunit [Rhizobium sp. Pop5]|nr:carbon-phosphorus lyase complex subunit [Rhizobium sp. Pop5]
MHLRIVEFRRRRGIHDVATMHLDRIGVGRGDAAVAGDIFVELHMHEAVFLKRMHLARLGLARLEEAQRLRDRHLIDEHLAWPELLFRNAVARLDDRRLFCMRRHRDLGDLLEEGADGNGVGRVIGALVNDLQHVIRPDDRSRHLHAAGAPAIGHRHFTRGEGHLVAGNGDRLQYGAADHPLGLFVEIGEVVAGEIGHSAASFMSSLPLRAASNSRRMRRTRSSSAWKST